MKIAEIISILDKEFPFASSEEWDNSGLIVGDSNSQVKKILVCLDASLAVLDYAEECGCELIISHHPVIFKAKKRFCAGSVEFEAVRRNIAIIALHTNLDKAVGGVNDSLCDILGFGYEKIPEPVCDGFLNIINFDEKIAVCDFVRFVKARLNAVVQYVEGSEYLTRLGVCSGAGAEFVEQASELSCDGFLTGEAKYHEFLDAESMGISLITAGHFETEAPIIRTLAVKLKELLADIDVFEYDSASIIKTEC